MVCQLTDTVSLLVKRAQFQRESITCYLRNLKIPAFLRRCPRSLKTDSGKASEWRRWTLHFSLPILSKILTGNQAKFLNHWAKFVQICHMVSLRKVTELQLASLRVAVREFVSGFHIYYGTNYEAVFSTMSSIFKVFLKL